MLAANGYQIYFLHHAFSTVWSILIYFDQVWWIKAHDTIARMNIYEQPAILMSKIGSLGFDPNPTPVLDLAACLWRTEKYTFHGMISLW